MKRSPLRGHMLLGALFVAVALILSGRAQAQDEGAPPPVPDSTKKAETYDNLYQGQFTPGAGFDVIRTEKGTLNISVYGLFRYVNQMPKDQTFEDHLGRTRTAKMRNDMNWHRTMLWVTGWAFDPKFRYNITGWSLASTEQTLIFGNLRYLMSPALTFGVGVGPNLTARSLQGSWPFWAGSDRQMAEEFTRGGFSSAFWISGRPFDRYLYYTLSVNRSISQLGNTVGDDTRDYAWSGSLWTQPTTGEYGPRGGFGDLEHHEQLATQFGMSAATSRESRYAPDTNSPKATQIKLSDSVNPFETGALANGVTVNRLLYREIAFDAGFKYKGFSFQSEYSLRELSDFEADGPLPLSRINDRAFFAEAMHMVVPKYLGIYAVGSKVYDEFDRRPWELGGGASVYPFGRRNWRLNLHVLHVEKSPAASNFGYYTGGMTGTILSLGTDILL